MLGGGAADAALLGDEDGEERNPALGYSLDDDSRRVWDDSRPSRELCEAFSEWHWENNCFHDYVVEFAFAHKDALLDVPAGEHSHGVHGLHKEFSESLEGFVSAFLKDHGATMEQFGAALQEQKESGDLCTRMTVEVVTDEVFALMEYAPLRRRLSETAVHTHVLLAAALGSRAPPPVPYLAPYIPAVLADTMHFTRQCWNPWHWRRARQVTA